MRPGNFFFELIISKIICKTKSQLALFFFPPWVKSVAPEVHEAGVRQFLKWESGDVGGRWRGEQKFEVWNFKDHKRKAFVS